VAIWPGHKKAQCRYQASAPGLPSPVGQLDQTTACMACPVRAMLAHRRPSTTEPQQGVVQVGWCLPSAVALARPSQAPRQPAPQASQGLPPTGVADKRTWRSLMARGAQPSGMYELTLKHSNYCNDCHAWYESEYLQDLQ
jgi:hypothetical protein